MPEKGTIEFALTDAEQMVYELMWQWAREAWPLATPMDPAVVMALDQCIMSYIKWRRTLGPNMRLDITKGQTGWLADQVLQKSISNLTSAWPNKPTKKADESAPESSKEDDDETILCYQGKEYNQDDWFAFTATLSSDEKVIANGNVKIITRKKGES